MRHIVLCVSTKIPSHINQNMREQGNAWRLWLTCCCDCSLLFIFCPDFLIPQNVDAPLSLFLPSPSRGFLESLVLLLDVFMYQAGVVPKAATRVSPNIMSVVSSRSVELPLEFDATKDPQIGSWVCVLPHRREAVLGHEISEQLLKRRQTKMFFVNIATGEVCDDSNAPLEFGGSDYVETVVDGRLVIRNRVTPSLFSTTDRSLLEPLEVPSWVRKLEVQWEALWKRQEEVHASCLARKRARE